MANDRIINQVRKIRRKIDLKYPDGESYYKHLEELQGRCGRRLVRRSPRRTDRAKAF